MVNWRQPMTRFLRKLQNYIFFPEFPFTRCQPFHCRLILYIHQPSKIKHLIELIMRKCCNKMENKESKINLQHLTKLIKLQFRVFYHNIWRSIEILELSVQIFFKRQILCFSTKIDFFRQRLQK